MHAIRAKEATMGTGALVWRRVVAMAMVPAIVGMTVVAGAAQEATPSAEVFGDDGVLTNCVDPSFPPMEYFESQDAQEPIGFDIDLINAIGERLGAEVTHIPTDFTGLLPALDAGRCDVVASGIYLTAERLETFDAQPYYDTSIVLLTPADNTDITSPENLAGKTVAVQAGTNYVEILNNLNAELQAAGQPAMDIQSYPDQTDAIQQLVVGRADATITQDTEAAFRETAQAGQFKIAYTYPDPQTFGIYFQQGSEPLAAVLAETVEAMRDDGTLAGIAETWNLPAEGTDYSTEVPAATAAATPAA
jgi:polar amino acid transport system substrate-binding protein